MRGSFARRGSWGRQGQCGGWWQPHSDLSSVQASAPGLEGLTSPLTQVVVLNDSSMVLALLHPFFLENSNIGIHAHHIAFSLFLYWELEIQFCIQDKLAWSVLGNARDATLSSTFVFRARGSSLTRSSWRGAATATATSPPFHPRSRR